MNGKIKEYLEHHPTADDDEVATALNKEYDWSLTANYVASIRTLLNFSQSR